MKSTFSRFFPLLLILSPLLQTSCNDLKYLTDNSPVLLEYQNHPTQYNLADLSKSYASAIKICQKRDSIRPGLYSEYAVTLALLGKNSEANKMFNNEVAYFPNSARYVRQLKLLLVPEYVSDTISDTSTVIDINLDDYRETDSSGIDPDQTKEAKENAKHEAKRQRELIKAQREAEKNAATQERELIKSIREKEKIQRKLEREAAKDSIETAKKEQMQIKEQMADEKERLKEERQQQKEEAKRIKAEQKAEAKRQKEIQREEARLQKEEARHQRELEREEARRLKELQKEEQRRQREEESDD